MIKSFLESFDFSRKTLRGRPRTNSTASSPIATKPPEEKAGESEASVGEKESNLEADDQTVKERRHKTGENGQRKKSCVAQQVHRNSREQACNRAENHVERTEHGERREVSEHAAEGQTRNSRRSKQRQNGKSLACTELDRGRGRLGKERCLEYGKNGVKRGDY